MITDQDVEKLKLTFATRKEHNELNEKVDGLTYEVGSLKVEVAELREHIDNGFNAINNRLDRFLGTVDTLMQENLAGAEVLRRHTTQIDALATHAGITLPA